MVTQPPLDQVFILSIWLESVLYGFLLALFLASVYVNVTLRQQQDGHSRAMFYIGILMFVIATTHLGMNCFRMIQGYVIHGNDPGGAVAYFGNLATWHHIFKDTLYASQEMLGDAVAIYRTYVIWSRNWKVVVLPTMLLIVGIVSGYSVCGLYPAEKAGSSIFDPRLLAWISTFYAVSFIQSLLTTGLMAYRIWTADRHAAKYRADKGNLMPILRILVESAALQLIIEIIVLGLYAGGNNAQYILLETITPSVAITFNAITIRIALRSSEALSMSRTSQQQISDHHHHHAQHATIGSIPMRPITISIKQDVEAHGDQADGRSDTEINFDQKR